jgi:RimJ/RimL family protein N-acetyltransferase
VESRGVALRAPEIPLTDGTVSLRPLQAEDAPAFARAVADPEIARRAYRDPPEPSDRGALEYIAQAGGRLAQGDAAILAVLDAVEAKLIGLTMLFALDGPNRTAELGFWTAPWARGRGIALRAVTVTVRWAFEELGVERAQAFTDADNVAAQQLMERSGFTREGLHRGAQRRGDRRIDEVSYGILAKDIAAGPDR